MIIYDNIIDLLDARPLEHRARKRELRSDKYMHDYQDFEHPDYFDQNYHNQFPIDDENNKIDIEELEEKFGKKEEPEKIFTIYDLADYNGEPDSKGLYLSIMGSVYDVSNGVQHYGPGGSYNFFAGKKDYIIVRHLNNIYNYSF